MGLRADVYVSIEGFAQFLGGCSTLNHMLGQHPWSETLCRSAPQPFYAAVLDRIGTLKAVKKAIENEWLATITGLLRAKTFSDLLEQAEHLQDQGYHVAAGVLGRAVLEQHLRALCDGNGCLPGKKRATIADYKMELYGHKHLDKVTMKHVEAMAAIGNDAAHNEPSLSKSDVDRLLRDMREFMVRHPLAK